MSLLEAILLGIVQGLTEFLPISSSGHLILVPWIQDYEFLREHPDFNRTFDVGLHFGTLTAVLAYFRHELRGVFYGFLRTVRSRSIGVGDERLAWVLILGTIPAVIVGLLFEESIDEHLAEPWTIAIFLALFAGILWHADRRPEHKHIGQVRLRYGVYVGLAQAIALMPGVSRSGVTISAARYLQLNREAAARLSFLLLVPAVLGATVYKGAETLIEGAPSGVAGPMVVGTIAAALSGYAAIAWLLRLVVRTSFNGFVTYRLVLAAAVAIVILTGLRDANF